MSINIFRENQLEDLKELNDIVTKYLNNNK